MEGSAISTGSNLSKLNKDGAVLPACAVLWEIAGSKESRYKSLGIPTLEGGNGHEGRKTN
ncbi:hypothetical protein Pan181_12320 [Aeoliella mucimassa]|uniref:Uncharacterized protein n=1 Tax=Aeoliella mucimassa TaxID=2527972 RepID=A0A518AK35_9BACT|nr:hypothetical protein Pan181_12320 [Aeoliella mucimassa]